MVETVGKETITLSLFNFLIRQGTMEGVGVALVVSFRAQRASEYARLTCTELRISSYRASDGMPAQSELQLGYGRTL